MAKKLLSERQIRRFAKLANLRPINEMTSMYEEEEEMESEPQVAYNEDAFLSAQEAQEETEGAEEDGNYTESELEEFTKRPDDLKNQ